MSLEFLPYRESLRATLTRTITLAVVLGAVAAAASGGGVRAWPVATLLMLWPAFGGHWVEVLFLNVVRPALPGARIVQAAARIAWWFVAGIVLGAGMFLTATVLDMTRRPRWPGWWVAGAAFVGIELIAHLVLQWRGRDSFFNVRG